MGAVRPRMVQCRVDRVCEQLARALWSCGHGKSTATKGEIEQHRR